MRAEVYDIECMANLFTYTGYCRTTKKWYQFVIHKLKNQIKELIEHLLSGGFVMIGYNNVSYDYPMIHHILNHADEYLIMEGDEIARRLYAKSQDVIDAEFSAISLKNTKIPQIDVYKIHHWDNPAKATSLKHCEMAMRMDNIEEMPIHHATFVKTWEEIQLTLDYNKHDVKATDLLFDHTLGRCEHAAYKGRDKLALRQLLSRNFKIDLMNHNDVKIGEDLVFSLYSQASGVPEYFLKKQRTPRAVIHLKDCIPSYIKFKTKVFKALVEKWRKTDIYSTKKAIEERVIYHGMAIDFGTGGIHGSNKGIFVSDDEMVVIDADVSLR